MKTKRSTRSRPLRPSTCFDCTPPRLSEMRSSSRQKWSISISESSTLGLRRQLTNRAQQAKRMYESERESIEGQYWDARDQVRQRLLGAIEDRRRKLRDEKEGGDVVTGKLPANGRTYSELTTESLLEAQMKPRPTRRMPFRSRIGSPTSGGDTPSAPPNHHPYTRPTSQVPNGTKHNDLMLHELLAPALSTISTDDILSPQSSSLTVIPPVNPTVTLPPGKRGPRQKETTENKELPAAPGTLTALAIASGQQAPAAPKGTRGAGATGQWVLGKSLAELKRMEQASQLEIDSDWARMQGSMGRGRRTRGD